MFEIRRVWPQVCICANATLTSFIFSLTGEVKEIERFIKVMNSVGLVEVSRTGVAAIARGAEAR